MNALEEALVGVAQFLDELQVPYMVIGGFANLRWGRPRLTQDLDITVQVADASLPEFVVRLGGRYRLLAGDALEFARATRVIPVATSAGTRIDLILAGLPYEEAAIRRARAVPVARTNVRLCSAEDLVLHKLASERPRDREDVEGVIVRQAGALDREYLDPLVSDLAAALERSEIVEYYHVCLSKAGLRDT